MVEHLAQRPLGVLEGEYDRGLVERLRLWTQLRHHERVGQNEKAREVALVCLDAALQYVEAVELGRIFAAYSRMARKLLFGNLAGRTCGVEFLHHAQVGVVPQIFLALHQRHRVGVDLRQVVDTLAGESRQHMGDARLVLAHYYGAAFAQ